MIELSKEVREIPVGFKAHDGESFKFEDQDVHIIMRDGGREISPASKLRWNHKGWPGDIVAYRLIPTIKNAVFYAKDASVEQVQDLLDIAKRDGISFWRNAAHARSYIRNADQHVFFYDEHTGLDGYDSGPDPDQVVVSYDEFLVLFADHYGEKVTLNIDIETDNVGDVAISVTPAPKHDPRPRYRKRRRQKPTVAKTIVRVLYTTQQVYTFKNVNSVQIINDKVYIQYEQDITEGIKQSSEVEINGDLVMAVVIHEVGNRSNFFRNIDSTWDFQAEDGTVINSGKQLGRIFKK